MLKLIKFKKTLIVTAFSLVCFLFYSFFPTEGVSQKISSLVIFLVVLPILFQKIIQKENLDRIGIGLGNWKKGLLFSSLSLLASFAVLYLLFQYPEFRKNYSIPGIFSQSFPFFLVYEFLIMGLFYLCFLFFFSGFLMFSAQKELGMIAPLFQFLLFVAFLFFTKNLNWLMIFIAINMLFSGITAFKSRSLLYPAISGILFSLISDSLVIKFIHNPNL